jgi:hypothetical protein
LSEYSKIGSRRQVAKRARPVSQPRPVAGAREGTLLFGGRLVAVAAGDRPLFLGQVTAHAVGQAGLFVVGVVGGSRRQQGDFFKRLNGYRGISCPLSGCLKEQQLLHPLHPKTVCIFI